MIKNFSRIITPELTLRVGIGLTLFYAGINSLVSPQNWIGYVPAFIGGIIQPSIFLFGHGIFEIILAIMLMLGFFKKITSLAALLSFSAIIIFYGVDDATFRDIGLTAAALTLFLMTQKKIDF